MTVYRKGITTMVLMYNMRAGRTKKVGDSHSNNRRFIMGYNI